MTLDEWTVLWGIMLFAGLTTLTWFCQKVFWGESFVEWIKEELEI